MQKTVTTKSGAEFRVRRAVRDDLADIVALLTDDPLGQTRESADLSAYERAFTLVDEDANQFLAAVEDDAGTLVGTFQLTTIPGLSRGGTTRLQVEGVRIARAARGAGLGHALFDWIEQFASSRGATLLQLTSDRSRADALRFYTALGYSPSHEGFKKSVPIGTPGS